MTNGVGNVNQAQQVAEQDLQDQIAGAGADPSYLQSDTVLFSQIETSDSAQISGRPGISRGVNSVLASGSSAVDEETYLENTSEYQQAIITDVEIDEDIAKLQNGTDKIDGSNEDVEELVNDILEEAGLSEKPAGMTDEEYQQAIAEALYNWLVDHWQYAQDMGDDYWQSVAESLGLKGDCEDFAILLASMLIAAGLDPNNVAVIVDAEGDHAYVAIQIGDSVFILDSGEMQDTGYSSLDQLLADDNLVGAWFKDNEYGVNNEDLDIDTADDTNGTSGTGGTSGGHGVGGAIGAANSLDSLATQDVLEFSMDEHMTYNTVTGYWEPDVEEVEQWMKRVMGRANALACILMALSMLTECKDIADESLTGVPIEAKKDAYKEVYARKIGFLMKMVKTVIAKLIETVNARNKELYEQRINEAKAENEGSGADFENFICGGSQEIETAEKCLEETINYLESTKRTLEAMQRMIDSFIQYLKQTLSSDDFQTLNMISSLEKFSKKIDEMNAEVDEGLEEAKEELDDLPDAQVVGIFGAIFAVLGNWVALLISYGIAQSYDFADDVDYMDTIAMDQMIKEYRGSMVAQGNAKRYALSLKMLQSDMRNVVRQEMTGLSGVSPNSEILMHSLESSVGATLSLFDITASQFMLKAQLHNNATKTIKGIQQLHKAQPIRLMSLALSCLMLAIAIVVTALTDGAAFVLILLAVSAGAALGKAAMDAYATDVASDVESYNPAAPSYQGEDGTLSSGNAVLDGVNGVEGQQESNMSNATSGSLTGQTKDEYYYFDAMKFASYEAKQTMLDNALRCIFSVMRNAKDLRRVVKAEMSGHSTPDSGEALLKNAVENIIAQRRMILAAIKFQHNEVVQAKNIAKQREIAYDKAWGSFWSSFGGALAGALLGFCLGGPVGIMLGVSIGSTLGSSIYQVAANPYDSSWDNGISYRQAQEQLDNLLRKKADQTLEGRLDRAELAAYQNLVANGMVSTGDGYVGVDYGLVSDTIDKLGRIFAIRQALAKIRALQSEIRSIVKQEMAGVSWGKIGELTQTVNSASMNAALTTVANITRFMAQNAQFRNRARDQEKAKNLATGLLVANAIISAAGFAGMGAGFYGGVSWAGSAANVAPALMAFINSLGSLIQIGMTANSDLGHYQGYQTRVRKTGRVTDNSQSIDDKIDQQEYELMMQMNSELIDTFNNGSFSAVSASSADLMSQMKGLHNLKEVLATVRSTMSALRDEVRSRMTGKRHGEVTYDKESVETYKQLSVQIMDALQNALNEICTRHNKMSQATRQIWLAAVQLAISTASLGVSIANAVNKTELAELEKNQQPTTADGGTAPEHSGGGVTQPSAPPAADPAADAAAASAAVAGEVTAGAAATDVAADVAEASETEARGEAAEGEAADGESADSEAAAGAAAAASAEMARAATTATTTAAESRESSSQPQAGEVSDGDHIRSVHELQRDTITLNKVSAWLTLANAVVSVLIPAIQVGVEEADDAEEKAACEAKARGKKHDAAQSKGQSNVFSSMDAMDASIDNSQYQMMQSQNISSATDAVAMQYEQIMTNIMNLMIKIPETVKALREKDDGGVLPSADRKIIENRLRDTQYSAQANAQYLINSYPSEQALVEAVELVQNMESPQRATAILNELETYAQEHQMQALQTRCEQAIAHLQTPARPTAATPTTTPAEQTPQTSRQRIEGLLARADQLLSEDSQVQEQIQTIDERIAQVDALRQEISRLNVTGAEVQQLTSAQPTAEQDTPITPQELLQRLQAERNALRTQRSQLVERMNNLRQELEANREVLSALRSGRAEAEVRELLARHGIDSTADLETLATTYVEQMEAKVTQLESQLTQARTDLQQIQARTASIQRDINTLQGRIEAIRAQGGRTHASVSDADGGQPEAEQAVEQPITVAQVTSAGAGSGLVDGLMTWLRGGRSSSRDEHDAIEASSDQAGEVVDTTHDALVKIAQAGHGNGRARDLYDQQARDMNILFGDSGAISGISSGAEVT